MYEHIFSFFLQAHFHSATGREEESKITPGWRTSSPITALNKETLERWSNAVQERELSCQVEGFVSDCTLKWSLSSPQEFSPLIVPTDADNGNLTVPGKLIPVSLDGCHLFKNYNSATPGKIYWHLDLELLNKIYSYWTKTYHWG